MTYTELKRAALERYFERTNEMQRRAIFRTKGAVLIIAGAGSGKTTVLCNRIANLLLFGEAFESEREREISDDDRAFLESFAAGKVEINADTTARLSDLVGENRATPWKILAVTFTNKAAAELKERLSKMNAPASDVWASTFHSCCVKILRKHIGLLDYKQNFTIYDSDDSLRVIKAVIKEMGLPEKQVNPKAVQTAISHAKDKLIAPEHFSVYRDGAQDFELASTRDIYASYQRRLKSANALDFDDIIMKTVELFKTAPEALSYWQNHFDYIMVDEYQDTNYAQFCLVSLLAQRLGNLCVVGDEDQSIYRFRGATIENILSFEQQFNSAVVKLEQNYRSTETILNAANAVIKQNTQRKEKSLWSNLGEGEKISVNRFSDEQTEALFVANKIMDAKEAGRPFSDHVILYRNNAQSRNIELALAKMAIPYRIIGGTRFYERKEIKDMLAYLSVMDNPDDLVRLKRVINEPKRNIGEVTQTEIENISLSLGLSPIEVMARAEEFAPLAKKAKSLVPAADMFSELVNGIEDRELPVLIDDILALTGYQAMLEAEGDEGQVRLENIRELKSSLISFCEENPDAELGDFLEQAALVADLDSFDENEDKVIMMTMHSAKGLEFDTVFIVGAEENIFPSYRSMLDPTEIEEERRLAYVAITRAKRLLYITTARQRLLYGQTQRNQPSRFVREIPEEFIEMNDTTKGMPARTKREHPLGYLQSQNQKPDLVRVGHSAKITDGDRVTHKIFGNGTVLSATPMGGDTLLEIAFDRVGTKKIMQNFAKVEKMA